MMRAWGLKKLKLPALAVAVSLGLAGMAQAQGVKVGWSICKRCWMARCAARLRKSA